MRLRLVFTLVFIVFVVKLHAQGGIWTWMSGANTAHGRPVFGTQGVPAANNTPPAAYESSSWIDLDGKFWLFGGNGDSGYYCDLWKYDPFTFMWTWVKGPGLPQQPGIYGVQGVPSPLNNPGGRGWGSYTWTDHNGDLWLYGGLGLDSLGNNNIMGDLWRYNIANNEWTWMSGIGIGGGVVGYIANYGSMGIAAPSNTPGSRDESNACWVDKDGNLWLFGGDCYDYNCADLWKYDISLNEWIWMKGPQNYNQPGNYGTKAVEDIANIPPGRSAYTTWQDTAGNFYLYGGINFFSWDVFNDIWRFNPVTNNWTWIAGDNFMGSSGKYDYQCQESSTVEPRGRFENKTAQVLKGANSFLSFGGSFVPLGSYTASMLADLWLFDLSTNQWDCISGDSSLSPHVSYGTYQVPASTNRPNPRAGHAQWIDNMGQFWIWGGMPVLNDLWRFVPDCSCTGGPIVIPDPIKFQLSDSSICKGDSTHLFIKNALDVHITPSAAVIIVDSTHFILFPDSTTRFIISGQTAVCAHYDTAFVFLNVLTDTVEIYINRNKICPGQNAQICAPSGYTNYLWNNGETTNCIYVALSGNYYVTVTENNQCSAISNHLSVYSYPLLYTQITVRGDTLTAYGANSYQWFLNGVSINGALSPTYICTAPGDYSVELIDSNGCMAFSNPITVGIENLKADELEIYPNPLHEGSWQLKVDEGLIGSLFEIFDERGRLVHRAKIINLNTSIDIDISRGVYFFSLQSANFQFTRKLVKL